MTRRLLVLLLALLLLPLAALADEAADGRDLQRLLDAYDRQGGGNTIPIEKEILALRDAGAFNALIRHLDHPRFGATVTWALAADPRPTTSRSIARMAGTWPPDTQGMALSTLGRLQDEDSLALLRNFQADPEFPGWAAPALRGALLRRGDKDLLASVHEDLRAKDAGRVSDALRTIGETYDPDWIPELARLAQDERVLPKKVRSRYRLESTQTDDAGHVHTLSVNPDLETVGALAVEAANRVVGHDTPEMIAWWYELEQKPRFGFGKDAAKALRRYAKLDMKARKQRLPGASTAVEALLETLRRDRPDAKSFHLDALDLSKGGWRLTATVDGGVLKATVDAEGKVQFGES